MSRIVRQALCTLIGAALLAAAGCSGSSSSPGAVIVPITASFIPSATAATPDLIRLRGQATGNQVALQVVLDGPHAASDLYSFSFDISIDADVAELTAVTAGDLFPVGSAATLASQQGDRIVVGVSLLEPAAPVSLAGSEAVLVNLTVRLDDGSSAVRFPGAPINLAGDPGPAALGRDGQVMPAITFDTSSAMISGSP